ncbi:MAG: hypothetical protein QXT82_09255 [Candidatus Caldarchaeum sp.]
MVWMACEGSGIEEEGRDVRQGNTVKPWFSGLKRMIKQFNTCFPTHRPKVSEKWITAWMALTVPSDFESRS